MNENDKNEDSEQDKINEIKKDRSGTSKRKRIETSPTHQHRDNPYKKPQKENLTITVPTHNQFDILSMNIDNMNEDKPPKPEPIFITEVKHISYLKEILNKVTKTEDYTMTTLRSGHVQTANKMINYIRIMTWNANGLTERKLELETFLII
ncbi:unnamed protein product [Leptidea sinapis]|uniref:Uncharacterized protein n=1 Tax=Leptidea sinapis TaxID=189913 RepID=A0A5E4R158_9NEOP|nr:unnamed protein product [Leptidea sinapis]